MGANPYLMERAPRELTPVAALRSALYELADLLSCRPPPAREEVRSRVQQLGTLCRQTGQDLPLLDLQLRNLLVDLNRGLVLDCDYYAHHLTLVVDRL